MTPVTLVSRFYFYTYVLRFRLKMPPHVQVDEQQCVRFQRQIWGFWILTMTNSKKVPPNDCDNDRQPEIAISPPVKVLQNTL